MFLDAIPVSLVFVVTLGMSLICLDLGVRFGRARTRRGAERLEAAGAMVGATMGLLAFLLAFTFNTAATRHETRKLLVTDEVNAIQTTWLRAGFLPEPYRADVRGLLREYVSLRLQAASGAVTLAEALRQSDALHEKLWIKAAEAGRADPGAITTGLFVQSLNEVIDLHLRRVGIGIRNRVPTPIWLTLYMLLVIGMFMTGLQIGQSTTRQFGIELALATCFSLVFLLIADLDRPQEGLLNVSQQAMSELQTRLSGR